MSLSKHVKAEHLLQSVKDHKFKDNHDKVMTAYCSRYSTQPLPKYKIPTKGVSPDTAYQLIHDSLELDGKTNQNLASFVNTWATDQAVKLCVENLSKNLVDQDEYPQTQVLHTRCISSLAHLWHAPHSSNAVGTATTGSSEAIQLGGLAMKKIWQAKRKEAGKSIHEPGPNIVMGANAQVALEKFARYFDVEMRLVPVTAESNYCLDPKRTMEYVDENTIGVFVILGSTYTGHFEPVKEMADLLDQYEAKTGISVPIHVDGASGAFVAPFVYPDLEWDFRIPRVVSINTSGHKFGLTFVGCGWIIWRDQAHLPKELVFELHYLGSVEYSFTLNFSRPAHPIINQYFNFIQLGFEGYRTIALDDLSNARLLSRALERSGYYTVLSDIHRRNSDLGKPRSQTHGCTDAKFQDYVKGLPVVAFCWTEEFRKRHPELKQRWIQTLLRAKGWIVPNYELPPELEHQEILRVVVRESMSEELIDHLIVSIMEITEALIKEGNPGRGFEVLNLSKTNEHPSGELKHEGSTKPTGYGRPC
ncbi:glutamate decarboxylase [Phakopsora pachyrhizi]|uniref:Glutamate decarboxylase n=1 Tax=Phakopsora pachyrhizi TaxID=170000 RepID=A0AAV0BSL5_PHAPC|nr:glutamate decarboxylase [Phakopsora pachyrhizi]